MKNKLKKSPTFYVAVTLLIILPIMATGYLLAGAIVTIGHKSQLADKGVLIIATVTDRERRFNSYNISYEFRYRSEAGTVQTARQMDFEVMKKEYENYAIGSTFVVSYLADEPSINQPVKSVKRLDPSSSMLIRFTGGLGVVYAAFAAQRKWLPEIVKSHSTKRNILIAIGIFLSAYGVGAVAGGLLVHLLETTLL
jgi:hypothetical protein